MTEPNISSATSATSTASKPGLAPRRATKPADLLKNLKSSSGQSKSKKPTILEQAAQDWNKCKVEENLEDELKQATKSKTGYLDKMGFLERTDLRQFQRERELRDQNRARAALNK